MPALLRSLSARRHRARSKLMHEARKKRFWNGSLSRKTDIHPRATMFEDSGPCRFRVNLFVKFRPRKCLQSLRMVRDRHEDSAAHGSALPKKRRTAPQPLRFKLDQLHPLQTRMPVVADDDVVVHGNAERGGDLDDRLGHMDISLRGAAGINAYPSPSSTILPMPGRPR